MHGRIAQSGSSLSTGDLRVLIYDANVSGNLVYDSGSDFNNAINDGVVDVVLGSNTQLDLNYGGYYYIDLSINGTDLDFNGSERKQFESSHGVVKTGSILDATITNSDISTTASIDWTKVSKSGADLNNFNWGSDFNNIYARRGSDVNVTGAWNFANTLTTQGGFGLGGVTISNGVLYTQSLVILNDLNAATVTAIDVNGNYTPFLDVTWSLGSSSNRWLGIFTRDLNATDINSTRASLGTLTLGTPLAKSQGGTGTTDFNSNGIVFYNGSALQDRSNFVVATDGNVGIGTTTPTKTLNIIGDLNVSSNGTGAPLIYARSTGVVGIGTTNPDSAYKLQVTGAGYFSSDLIAGGTFYTSSVNGSGGGAITLGSNNSSTTLQSNSSSFIKFQNNSLQENMRITGDGNIGIGIATPVHKLDVNGTTRIRAGTTDANVLNVQDSSGKNLFTVKADGNFLMVSPNNTTFNCGVANNGTFQCS
ncbi:MAG TPA: hypothetical protein VJG83_02510 [archaeon]|nr:hypothetical protein [archaeon]